MKRLITAIVLAAVVFGVLFAQRPTAANSAKWTFMVYLDADNNLEDIGIDNFLSMAKVGSSDDVNIVLQFDRAIGGDSRYGDWTTTKRFLVQKDMIPDVGSELADIGEQNMADPLTLSNFATWAISSYPADHYFLDIWDHGLGWQGVAMDDVPASGDRLTAPELGQALNNITQYLGRPLDILANDACRMTLEIMYEVAPYAQYLVGSEKDEPAEGWPYDRVLGALAVNPSMSSVDLAKILVDEYVDFYRSGSSYSVTMALIDSSALPELIGSLSGLVTAVNLTLPYYREPVSLARNESEHYEGNQCTVPMSGEDYDLYDVTLRLMTRLGSGRVLTAASALLAAIESAVMYEQHMDLPTAVNCVRALNAYGLSIWYPWDIAAKAAAYSQLALSRDSLWDEHLATYHSGKSLDVNLTAGLTLRDDDMNGAYDRGEIAFSSSQDGDVCIDMFRDLDLISSDIHAVSASVTYMRNVTFSSPGSYIIFLTFSQAGGTMNITWFPPIVVGTNITFRGIVRDAYGNNIAGAKVTMKNLRTGDEINATVDQAHYTFSVFYPVWMMNGDNLKLVATADGRSTTFEVKFEYIGSNLVWIDFYIPATNATDGEASLFGDYWPLVLIPIATLIMEIVLLALILRGEKTRRRRAK